MIGKHRILLFDGDRVIISKIQNILLEYDIEVICALSSSEAIKLFVNQEFCLVIMDVRTKDANGIEILQFMRDTKATPVLVVSHVQEDEVVHILRAGATACLAKPVDVDLCAAQALSLMRLYDALKVPESYGLSLTFGIDFIMDPSYRQVIANGESLHLTRHEFDVLYYLANNRQLAIRYDKIYEEVWGSEPASIAAVRACVNQLRKKLQGVKNVSIRNVWGIGYQFVYED